MKISITSAALVFQFPPPC